jgi:hypothetical protein
MSPLKLTPSLLSMLERIEQHSGTLLMLAETASGGREYGKLNKLRAAGYVVKCDQPTVTEGAWPAEALAITAMLVGRRLRSKVPGTAIRSKSSGRSILHARGRAARLDPAVSTRQSGTTSPKSSLAALAVP